MQMSCICKKCELMMKNKWCNKMKNKLAIFMVLALMLSFASACGKKELAGEKKLEILCTTFSAYDWAREVVGEDNQQVEVNMLVENGVDLHNFQPSAQDILRIKSADVFIYVGGVSDQWIEEVLEDKSKGLCLMEVLEDSLCYEEVVEGMEAHEHEDAEAEHAEPEHAEHENEDAEAEHEEHEHDEYDEHVWLSLENAKIVVEEIENRLCALDDSQAELYQKNSATYQAELEELNQQYQQVIAGSQRGEILVADRFPFRYMVEDYGLDYYAAFVGCSQETEASFQTIKYLADCINEEHFDVVYVVENSNQEVAKAVIQATNGATPEICVLNSIQSVPAVEIQAGATYLGYMTENLEQLKKGL